MCYSPLRILNPKKQPTYRDKLYLTVPCGKCKQCRDRKVNDYAVRSYFEGLYTRSLGGINLFCTFGYSMLTVPRDENGNPTFDKHDIQNFFKVLRNKLGMESFRYLICAEYGSLSNLPHFHAIIHYNKCCVGSDIFHIISTIKYTWQGLDKWKVTDSDIPKMKRGFAKVEEVDSFKGFRYVCKYVNKGLDLPCDLPDSSKPFHLQSKGYGSYLLDYYGFKSNKNQCKNMQSILDGSIALPNGRVCALPQYYSKKLFYDYQYHWVQEIEEVDLKHKKKLIVEWHLNDFGEYVQYNRSYRSIEQTKQEIADYLNYYKLINVNITHANKYLHSDFKSATDFCQFVTNILRKDVDISRLALYISTFKDRVIIPYSYYDTFCPFADTSISDARSFVPTLHQAYNYLSTLYDDIDRYPLNPVLFDHFTRKPWHESQTYIDVVSRRLYNNLFPSSYDILSNILNYMMFVNKENEQKKYEELQIFVEQAKQLSPNII